MKVLAFAVLLIAGSARGQGCSQCREAVGQTPARTQHAYRAGIIVLATAATCVCGATALVIRRYR